MNNLQTRLKEGEVVNFSSDEHELEAWFDDSITWHGGFKIWFNGTLVHSSKTFISFERKLNRLLAEYSLRDVQEVAAA